MRRVGQARKGPMLLKLYGPKPGPARRTQARGQARPDVLRPEARPGPRGLRARAGLGPGLRPLVDTEESDDSSLEIQDDITNTPALKLAPPVLVDNLGEELYCHEETSLPKARAWGVHSKNLSGYF